jgi:hypothetical protein
MADSSLPQACKTQACNTQVYEPHVCPYCKDLITFDHLAYLHEHLEHVHYICIFCVLKPKFDGELGLAKHLRAKHPAVFIDKN